MSGRRWWLACGLMLAATLGILAPVLGDLGLTYDEPAYRYSQEVSIQWWEQLGRVQTWSDIKALLEPDVLLYYWPYARHGINFHPPLAGQLDLLAYVLAGGWLGDIPARRLASSCALALSVTLLFGFVARRYGFWAGLAAGGSLLFMPRVFGQALLIETDTPGMLIWTAAAFAFWNGLYAERGRGLWRIAFGLLVGLAFLEKMASIFVLLPAFVWLVLAYPPWSSRRAAWIDGLASSTALLVPLGVAFLEIRRLARILPPPQNTDLFLIPKDLSPLPGWILIMPLAIWLVRRFLGRAWKSSPIWGVERPALESWEAVLAFAPAVGWLGNPAWWRETLPRLAHYYALNTARRGSLPDIRICYLGEIYEYSLPWHNGWVLPLVTVPISLLAAAAAGLAVAAFRGVRLRDRLPLYFLLQMIAIPILRMLPTPAHDGVRLMLPTFVFLAAFAGIGCGAIGPLLARWWPAERSKPLVPGLLVLIVLGPAAFAIARIHPYELSFYNVILGGPRSAWHKGFELSYWYDAFNPDALRQLDTVLPPNAAVAFASELSAPSTFQELQSLGILRGDIALNATYQTAFPHYWLLTHDSKAEPFTRLLFAMRPSWSSRPRQLDGAQVAAVASPIGASRALALQLLADGGEVRRDAGKAPEPTLNEAVFRLAREDPEAFITAARAVAHGGELDPNTRALQDELMRSKAVFLGQLRAPAILQLVQRLRPDALAEAATILVRRPDDVRNVLLRRSFTDPDTLGGHLDDGLPRNGNSSLSRKTTWSVSGTGSGRLRSVPTQKISSTQQKGDRLRTSAAGACSENLKQSAKGDRLRTSAAGACSPFAAMSPKLEKTGTGTSADSGASPVFSKPLPA